jgi:alpha-tubulin suppressor-like RCC1 family protein
MVSGYNYTMLLLDNGKMYGWGNNGSAQIGSRSTGVTTMLEATVITEHCTNENVQITDFTCLGYTTVVYFTNNTVYAVGHNGSGVMGIGHSNSNVGMELIACTSVNDKLEEGYTINQMCAKGDAILYQLRYKEDDSLTWWGLGANRHNRSLGTSKAEPITTLHHMELLQQLVDGFSDPTDYVVGSGPSYYSISAILDRGGKKVWFSGYGHHIHWSDHPSFTMKIDLNSSTYANKTFMSCAVNQHGIFLFEGNPNDKRDILDTNPSIKVDTLRILNFETTWSSAIGTQLTGSVRGSDKNEESRYRIFVTSDLSTTTDTVEAGFADGSLSPQLEGTLGKRGVRSFDLFSIPHTWNQGSNVDSRSIPHFAVIVIVDSGGVKDTKRLVYPSESTITTYFPLHGAVLSNNFNRDTKMVDVRVSLYDRFNVPSKYYVALFENYQDAQYTNSEIINTIVSMSELTGLPVSSEEVSGAAGLVYVKEKISFSQAISALTPNIDEETYTYLRNTKSTTIVSNHVTDNYLLTGETSYTAPRWYMDENHLQSPAQVSKWTLTNGDILYADEFGPRFFDDDRETIHTCRHMYNWNLTETINGASRSSLRKWQFFYEFSTELIVNCFNLFNSTSNGVQYLMDIAVFDTNLNYFISLTPEQGSYPFETFNDGNTGVGADFECLFQSIQVGPGRPIRIVLGRQSTTMALKELQLSMKELPPVRPTFYKYLRIHVKSNKGGGEFYCVRKAMVDADMEIVSQSSSVEGAAGYELSNMFDTNEFNEFRTVDTTPFNLDYEYTHGLPSTFNIDFDFGDTNVDRGWSSIEIYVSQDATTWSMIKTTTLSESSLESVNCVIVPELSNVSDRDYVAYVVGENNIGERRLYSYTPMKLRTTSMLKRMLTIGSHSHGAHGVEQDSGSRYVGLSEPSGVRIWLNDNPSIYIVNVFGGGHHTLFEVRESGLQRFYAIGYNYQGELASDESEQMLWMPVPCDRLHRLMTVHGSVRTIRCGWHFTTALMEDGKLFSWGQNDFAQFGNKTTGRDTEGQENLLASEYCESNNTEIQLFGCTGYNTVIYFKNKYVRITGRYNGHGQFGRGDTSEHNNTSMYHVSQIDGYARNVNREITAIKCDYGSIAYRTEPEEGFDDGTGEMWYGAGQNHNQSMGYSGNQVTGIVPCDLLNNFIRDNDMHGNYDLVYGMMYATLLVDRRDGKVYGIGSIASGNSDLASSSVIREVVSSDNVNFHPISKEELSERTPSFVPYVYGTTQYGVWVGGAYDTDIVPILYENGTAPYFNTMRIINLEMNHDIKDRTWTLGFSFVGDIETEASYKVYLTSEVPMFSESTITELPSPDFEGTIPKEKSGLLEFKIETVRDGINQAVPVAGLSQIDAMVILETSKYRVNFTKMFPISVDKPLIKINNVAYNPLNGTFDMNIFTYDPFDAISELSIVVMEPGKNAPTFDNLSYYLPMNSTSTNLSYSLNLRNMMQFSIVSEIETAASDSSFVLITKENEFTLTAVPDAGRLEFDYVSVFNTDHIDRQVESPVSSTFWRIYIYNVQGGHGDYATFTQMVLTDSSGQYPIAPTDQGADTLYDKVGMTNTNVYRYNHGHKITYQYETPLEPTELIWAYRASSNTRAPSRILLQYATTDELSTATWEDYAYIDLYPKTSDGSTPAFHNVEVNVDDGTGVYHRSVVTPDGFFASGNTVISMVVDSLRNQIEFYNMGRLSHVVKDVYIGIGTYTGVIRYDTAQTGFKETRMYECRLTSDDVMHLYMMRHLEHINNVKLNSIMKVYPTHSTPGVMDNTFVSVSEVIADNYTLTGGMPTRAQVKPDTLYDVLVVGRNLDSSVNVLASSDFTATPFYTSMNWGWGSGHNHHYALGYSHSHNSNSTWYRLDYVINELAAHGKEAVILDVMPGETFIMYLLYIDGVPTLYGSGRNTSGQIGRSYHTDINSVMESLEFNQYAQDNNTTIKLVRPGSESTAVLYMNGDVVHMGKNNGSFGTEDNVDSVSKVRVATAVKEYCMSNGCSVIDMAVTHDSCCFYLSNNKVIGNTRAMGSTTNNADFVLREVSLNEHIGSNYRVTLMRSMVSSYIFRLTHTSTGEEQWWGTGEQYSAGGGGVTTADAYTNKYDRLTQLEELLATFEDPKNYDYSMGYARGATIVTDRTTNDVWRIGYFGHVTGASTTTTFVKMTDYVSKDWLETNSSNTYLQNFTPTIWRMGIYSIFVFGTLTEGSNAYRVGGEGAGVNLKMVKINNLQTKFVEFVDSSKVIEEIPKTMFYSGGEMTQGVLGQGYVGDGHRTFQTAQGLQTFQTNNKDHEILKLITGANHAFILTYNKTNDKVELYGFGQNTVYELGVNNNSSQGAPTLCVLPMEYAEANDTMIVDVVAGWSYTHFIFGNGDIRSAGVNTKGTLLDGTTTNSGNKLIEPTLLNTMQKGSYRILGCGASSVYIGASTVLTPVYPLTVTSKALVLYDAARSNTIDGNLLKDFSGNYRDSIITGGLTIQDDGFVFTGSNYTRLLNSVGNPGGDWRHSVSIWINFDTWPVSHTRQTPWFMGVAQNNKAASLDLQNIPRIDWFFYHNDVQFTDVNDLQANTWYHLCFVYDNADNRLLYINGVLSETNLSPGPLNIDANTNLWLGRDGARNATAFYGKIRQFAIYDGVLTAEEVLQNYHAIAGEMKLRPASSGVLNKVYTNGFNGNGVMTNGDTTEKTYDALYEVVELNEKLAEPNVSMEAFYAQYNQWQVRLRTTDVEFGRRITFTVGVSGSAYSITADVNDVITTSGGISVYATDILIFNVNVAGHPFHIKSGDRSLTGPDVEDVINQGATNGTLEWSPALVNPETNFYFQCEYHDGMHGSIEIKEPVEWWGAGENYYNSLGSTTTGARTSMVRLNSLESKLRTFETSNPYNSDNYIFASGTHRGALIVMDPITRKVFSCGYFAHAQQISDDQSLTDRTSQFTSALGQSILNITTAILFTAYGIYFIGDDIDKFPRVIYANDEVGFHATVDIRTGRNEIDVYVIASCDPAFDVSKAESQIMKGANGAVVHEIYDKNQGSISKKYNFSKLISDDNTIVNTEHVNQALVYVMIRDKHGLADAKGSSIITRQNTSDSEVYTMIHSVEHNSAMDRLLMDVSVFYPDKSEKSAYDKYLGTIAYETLNSSPTDMDLVTMNKYKSNPFVSHLIVDKIGTDSRYVSTTPYSDYTSNNLNVRIFNKFGVRTNIVNYSVQIDRYIDYISGVFSNNGLDVTIVKPEGVSSDVRYTLIATLTNLSISTVKDLMLNYNREVVFNENELITKAIDNKGKIYSMNILSKVHVYAIALKDVPISGTIDNTVSTNMDYETVVFDREEPRLFVNSTERKSDTEVEITNEVFLTKETDRIYTTCVRLVGVDPLIQTTYVTVKDGRYEFRGAFEGTQPDIVLYVGDSFNIVADILGYPMRIKTKNVTGSAFTVPEVFMNGEISGVINWTPMNAGTYYYVSEDYAVMHGRIFVYTRLNKLTFDKSDVLELMSTDLTSDAIVEMTPPEVPYGIFAHAPVATLTSALDTTTGVTRPITPNDVNLLAVSIVRTATDDIYYSTRYISLKNYYDASSVRRQDGNMGWDISQLENNRIGLYSHNSWRWLMLDGVIDDVEPGSYFEFLMDYPKDVFRYQPMTIFDDNNKGYLSLYSHFDQTNFYFHGDMISNETRSEYMSSIVLGEEYRHANAVASHVYIERKDGNKICDTVTHFRMRFALLEDLSNPEQYRYYVTILDQDGNLVMRGDGKWFHSNSGGSFGATSTIRYFPTSMKTMSFRWYAYQHNPTYYIQEFVSGMENVVRDSYLKANESEEDEVGTIFSSQVYHESYRGVLTLTKEQPLWTSSTSLYELKETGWEQENVSIQMWLKYSGDLLKIRKDSEDEEGDGRYRHNSMFFSNIGPYLTLWDQTSSKWALLRIYKHNSSYIHIHIPADRWSHVVVVWRSKIMEVYVNGTMVSQYDATNAEDIPAIKYNSAGTADTAALYGRYVYPYAESPYVEMKISNAAIWTTTALSKDQIVSLYDNGTGYLHNQYVSNILNSATWYFPLETEPYEGLHATDTIVLTKRLPASTYELLVWVDASAETASSINGTVPATNLATNSSMTVNGTIPIITVGLNKVPMFDCLAGGLSYTIGRYSSLYSSYANFEAFTICVFKVNSPQNWMKLGGWGKDGAIFGQSRFGSTTTLMVQLDSNSSETNGAANVFSGVNANSYFVSYASVKPKTSNGTYEITHEMWSFVSNYSDKTLYHSTTYTTDLTTAFPRRPDETDFFIGQDRAGVYSGCYIGETRFYKGTQTIEEKDKLIDIVIDKWSKRV